MGANGIMGGAGNTMPFSLMGLKSKSKRIQAVSKASFVPGLFGINEPAIFGYPIMYNGLLLIPFMLCPMVCSALLLDRLSAGADHDHPAGRVPDLPYYTGLAQRHLRDPDVPGLLADLAPLLQDL